MSKRKLAPTALYSELSEYSSLLRALRASNTLDVASHMTRRDPGCGAANELNLGDDLDDEEIDEGVDATDDILEQDDGTDTVTNVNFPPSSAYDSRDVSPSQTGGPSSPIDGALRPISQKRKREPSPSPVPQRRRDAWTRWPLLVDDVHVPEWTLEDEIGHLAANAFKIHPRPPFPFIGSEDRAASEEDLDDAWDIDTDPSFLPNLTNAASNHLSAILALLVAHTPNRPQGMQNRVEPMDWRAVLEVLSSCGDPSIADSKIINSVKSRMEALYGPSGNDRSAPNVLDIAAHRIQCNAQAKEKLTAQISGPMENLLTFPSPPKDEIPEPQKRRRKTRRKTKKCTPTHISSDDG